MRARQTIALPPIGDHRNVPVIEILVKPGDSIARDDPVITLESDKATLEVPSPAAGTVVELLVGLGDPVSQGMPILVIEGADAADGEAAPPAPVPVAPVPSAPLSPPDAERPAPAAPPAAASAAHASPSVRAFARELGVDLAQVPASGRKHRILREDVAAYVKQRTAPGVGAPLAGLPSPPRPDFASYGPVERVPLTRIQQLSGAALHRNWTTIPHVTSFDEADITELEAFRQQLNVEGRDPPVRLTLVAFLVKAAARALALHPRFNASLDGDALVLKKYTHIGVAVDTPRGLVVPVLRDADRKGLLEIGSEVAALAARAREGRLTPDEMEGGSMSVSSLGGIGGTGFTPIINAPEVAIVGAARAAIQPRWDGAAFQPRLVLPLNLSWDHRVVDGVAAARFLGTLAEILGDFRRALL